MNSDIEHLFKVEGVPSGYTNLENQPLIWKNSDLIIIASRPSVGKSAFALNVALNAAVGMNIPVLYFSLEMNSRILAKRMIVRESGINLKEMTPNRSFNQHDWIHIEKRLLRLKDCPLYIDDTPGLLIEDFTEKVETSIKEKGIKLVIIDYLQLMRAHEKYLGMRADEVAYIIRTLKAVAMSFDIPIVALSQLSRFSLSTGEHRVPKLSDLREPAHAQEEAADLILFIDRPSDEKIKENPDMANNAEIIVAKNRNGILESIPMEYYKESFLFKNLERL